MTSQARSLNITSQAGSVGDARGCPTISSLQKKCKHILNLSTHLEKHIPVRLKYQYIYFKNRNFSLICNWHIILDGLLMTGSLGLSLVLKQHVKDHQGLDISTEEPECCRTQEMTHNPITKQRTFGHWNTFFFFTIFNKSIFPIINYLKLH